MMPVGDSTVRGTIEFQGGHASPLMIQVALMGLQAGSHGIHVHMGSDCASPGEHFNPDSAQHGAATGGADARHRGDLGNVTADASGVVQQMLRDPVLGTDHSFIGKVIVVHDRPDDLTTQPSGGSGEPVACGVIEEADTSLSRAPGGDRGV
jgi:Cu/Zn superoxide dismutase